MACSTVFNFRQFVESSVGHDILVGVDVHKRSYHASLRRADGQIATLVCPAEPHDFVSRIAETGMLVRCIAHEVGPTGYALARAANSIGIPVVVAAPSRIPRSVAPGAKTDRLDCIRLAEYAAMGLMGSIAVPNQVEESERLLPRRRHQATDSTRRVKALLLLLGVAEPAA